MREATAGSPARPARYPDNAPNAAKPARPAPRGRQGAKPRRRSERKVDVGLGLVESGALRCRPPLL